MTVQAHRPDVVPLHRAPLRAIRHREVLANRERLYLACGHAVERRYAGWATRARCIECLTEGRP